MDAVSVAIIILAVALGYSIIGTKAWIDTIDIGKFKITFRKRKQKEKPADDDKDTDGPSNIG